MNNDDLLTRGIANVIPKDLAEKKLKSEKKLRIYMGIDPTGNKLHIGHSVPLRKLQAFADAGHHVVFLIGSFTAMIGDPTGRTELREQLTKKEVEKNFKTYKKQASKILNFKKVEIRYNDEWHEKLKGAKMMDVFSHFTLQQMMQRDMFRDRMSWKVICANCKEMFNSPIQFSSPEKFEEAKLEGNSAECPNCKKETPCNKENIIPPPNPVSPVEFMYPIMQAYDSVILDVDCEIGGNDQTFNMLCGRKLQKVYGKREKFILTTKLLEGTDGRKMSKSYDNCIYLDDNPTDMFGKVMSVNDDLMETYFECCTDVPMNEVHVMLSEATKGSGVAARKAKARLAFEITKLYHGEKDAQKAQEEFNNIFTKKGAPEDMASTKVEKGSFIIDVIVKNGLAPSKAEAKRLIEQGGVKMNDQAVNTVDAVVEEGVLKVGKRKFLSIEIK